MLIAYKSTYVRSCCCPLPAPLNCIRLPCYKGSMRVVIIILLYCNVELHFQSAGCYLFAALGRVKT